jgi:hypothetical protein
MSNKKLRKYLQEFLFLHDRKMAQDYDVMNTPIESVFKTVVLETMVKERTPLAFMVFMDKYAAIAYNTDKYHGSVMMTLALHRIAHALKAQEAASEKPVKYNRYFKDYAKQAIMTKTDWEFLHKHIDLALRIPQTAEQARLILFSVMEHIDRNGNVQNLNTEILPYAPLSIRHWAENRVRHLDFEAVHSYFARPDKYVHNIDFFQDNWDHFNLSSLAKDLGFKGLFKRLKLKKAIWS